MSTRFSLTTEQEAAVSNRGGSLLVSAAAGAGKTMVLVERLMRYLTDPNNVADITDFLVITYTRAAAAELRSKILNEVSSRIAEHPDDRHLRRQASLCLKASISTIHSFCTDMIRENAHVLDLPQDIRVIDGDEAGLIKSEVLDRVLESRYCDLENDKEFHELVDCMAESRGDENLRNALLDAHASLRSHPNPEAWIQEQLNAFALDGVEDISCTVWGSELIDWSSRIIEHVRDSMKNGYEKLTADPKAFAAYGESFRYDGIHEYSNGLIEIR